MISETKVREIQALVDAEVEKGKGGLGLIVVTVPERASRQRRIYAFPTTLTPIARRAGGWVDRGDRIDREMCLFYDWEQAIDLGLS